jgi:hypothetical protein
MNTRNLLILALGCAAVTTLFPGCGKHDSITQAGKKDAAAGWPVSSVEEVNLLPYVTSLEEVLWGGTLVTITMVMHGFGMVSILRVTGAMKERLARAPSFLSGMGVLVLASWLILIVHLLEVFAWAGFFYWREAVNSQTNTPATASLCYYLALMDYTTLGSNYNLLVRWRLLEGMIAVAGLLTFAWSTGVLFTLAQEFQDEQLQLIKKRRAKDSPQFQPQHGEPSAGGRSS